MPEERRGGRPLMCPKCLGQFTPSHAYINCLWLVALGPTIGAFPLFRLHRAWLLVGVLLLWVPMLCVTMFLSALLISPRLEP